MQKRTIAGGYHKGRPVLRLPHHYETREKRGHHADSNQLKSTTVLHPSSHEPGTLKTVSSGVVRGLEPLPVKRLEVGVRTCQLAVHLTGNPVGGTRVDFPAGTGTQNLEDMYVVSWQFSADLQDPNTGAFPVGPVMMKIDGSKLPGFVLFGDNVTGYPTRFYPLMVNFNVGGTYTEMPQHVGDTRIAHWRQGNGDITNFTISFHPISDLGARLTFTDCTILFRTHPSNQYS